MHALGLILFPLAITSTQSDPKVPSLTPAPGFYLAEEIDLSVNLEPQRFERRIRYLVGARLGYRHVIDRVAITPELKVLFSLDRGGTSVVLDRLLAMAGGVIDLNGPVVPLALVFVGYAQTQRRRGLLAEYGLGVRLQNFALAVSYNQPLGWGAVDWVNVQFSGALHL